MGLTIDSSVFVDSIIPKVKDRHDKSKNFIKLSVELGEDIFEPRIMLVEIAGVLSRFKPVEEIKEILSIAEFVEILPEEKIFETAISTAFDTHCRAVDAYFISTAKITGSILITNDKIMAKNASNSGVEAYYLIEDFDRIVHRLTGR